MDLKTLAEFFGTLPQFFSAYGNQVLHTFCVFGKLCQLLAHFHKFWNTL